MYNCNMKVNTHSFTKEWVFWRFSHCQLLSYHHCAIFICNRLENSIKNDGGETRFTAGIELPDLIGISLYAYEVRPSEKIPCDGKIISCRQAKNPRDKRGLEVFYRPFNLLVLFTFDIDGIVVPVLIVPGEVFEGDCCRGGGNIDRLYEKLVLVLY